MMWIGFVLVALALSVILTSLLLLVTFLLLPWAKQRIGRWALALIPVSTFSGAYMGWALMLLLIAR